MRDNPLIYNNGWIYEETDKGPPILVHKLNPIKRRFRIKALSIYLEGSYCFREVSVKDKIRIQKYPLRKGMYYSSRVYVQWLYPFSKHNH
jgi:hypothetical protein